MDIDMYEAIVLACFMSNGTINTDTCTKFVDESKLYETEVTCKESINKFLYALRMAYPNIEIIYESKCLITRSL